MISTSTQHFYFFVLILFVLISADTKAQKIDTISTFSITAYADAYYAYYTDSAGPGKFEKFAAISPRSNTPSINTAQVAFTYSADKIRATAVFHYGDVALSSWSPVYNNIQEAHVGFKVYSKLWIDAGFFKSHFGTESLMPVDNIASSLAAGTYYEPFYESGIRLNFDPTKKLEINLFLLNGYNMLVDNNNKKSFGMGITYTINDYCGIGYTNYIGDDTPPDSTANHLRIAQNVFLNYQRGKIKAQIGADYFLQQNSDLSQQKLYASMYTALASLKYQWTKQFAVYGRGEIFHDPNGFVSTIIIDNTGHQTGYKLFGITSGAEYKPTPESYVKLEGRWLQMNKDQYIFNNNGTTYNNRFEIMVHAGVTFDLLKNVRRKIDS